VRTVQTLLEREQELDLLAGLLDDVGLSGGRVVLVRGEAGIGKTTLVRGFIDRHGDKAHVLVGSCDDLLTARPLGPFRDMARQESSLVDPLKNDDRSGMMDTALDLLSRNLRPTLVVIEDTQWADEATLDVINFLGRRIAQTNGLLLLTYRDGEVDPDHPLRGVIGDLPPGSVVRIRLDGLSPAAVASLIGGSNLDAEEVFAATDGNPFLVTEMASVEGEAVPSSVQDSVMARVGKLSSGAQEMLRILSVIPERIPRGEVSQLARGAEAWLPECERRGLLDVGDEVVTFRHELIRRAVEESLTKSERVATNRIVLEALPADTDPARLVHHARQADDIDRLVQLAPKAAAEAAALGSHREAVDHFRQLRSHLDRLHPDVKGPFLEEWAGEEEQGDNISEAIRLNEQALLHYRELGDRGGESGALAHTAHCYEYAGQRSRAEEFARQALEVLGPDPDGEDLARALEVNAFMAMMAQDVTATHELVERTLEAAGPDVDERILIRCLNHRGCAANVSSYPDGQASLDESRERAQVAGLWSEEVRALANHAEMALEFRDLPTATDYIQRTTALYIRHDSPGGGYATGIHARVLELKGEWDQAEDLARDLLNRHALAQMVALPVLGVIEARTGRDSARTTLRQAWELAVTSGEFQRLAPAATALAEHSWISGDADIPVSEIRGIMETGLHIYRGWPSGSIALWLWKLGQLAEAPDGIAEPHRLVMEGDPLAAAEILAERGCPYEQAIALTHGDTEAQFKALDIFDNLGATAVADKLRQELRDEGMTPPRPKRRRTFQAGLTVRQAEVLNLLAEGLSNLDIADRLFLSPRTVEHHVAAVMSKLNASTRDQAVASAAEQGLLTSS